MYWVTSRASDHHARTPTVPDLVSPSKSEDPGPSRAEPSSGASRVLFKLGHSKKASLTGVTSMQVISVSNLLSRSDPLNLPFYRSGSLPSGLTSTVNHLLTSRNTSCRKYLLFRKPIPTKYERRTVLLTLTNRLPLQLCLWESIPLSIGVIYSVNES